MPLKHMPAIILAMVLAVSGWSCSRDKTPSFPGLAGPPVSTTLTRRQLKNMQLVTGKIRKQEITRTFTCQGTVVLPPSATLFLCAPVDGVLQSVSAIDGSYVKSGTELAEIASAGFLELQQEYLVEKSLLKYHEAAFRRLGELTLEDASSIRDLEKAEADFRTTEVACRALEEKLALLGIQADSLHVGNISSRMRIVAPVSGFLSSENAFEGSYALQNRPLFRLTEIRNPRLRVMVPEPFTDEVQEGMSFRFSFRSDEAPRFSAMVKSRSYETDQPSGTLAAMADIDDMPQDLFPGRRVYATFETSPDSAYVLPSKAVVSMPEGTFLVVLENRSLARVGVEIRPAGEGLVEIILRDETLLGMDFVVAGAGWANTTLEQF